MAVKSLISLLNKLVPESVVELKRRYKILDGIDRMDLIGRRKLSQLLGVPERILRSDTDYMKTEGLIEVTGAGMRITEEGEKLLMGLTEFMDQFKDYKEVQEAVGRLLGDVHVVVVPGNADEEDEVKMHIGRAAAQILYKTIKPDQTIAITGGSTVARMVEQCKKHHSKKDESLTVLPARGGLGKLVELQANTLASTLAKKLGAKYRLLNVPDNLSSKAFESVQKEPEIREISQQLEHTDVILFGIGDAFEMAKRRKINDKLKDELLVSRAVGEAFGYYFNEEGQVVYRSRTIGIDLDKVKETLPIAMAGGAKKAKAIYATKDCLSHGYLIIDEGAANEILRLYQ